MSKPRLLDLFSGSGGAGMGYHLAGFEVIGVDIRPQPHYPFEFHQADALTFPLDGFDLIHASPPCQAYSVTRSLWPDRERDDLVDATRSRLEAAAIPFVIENVPGAPLRPDMTLCGAMFGLRVKRHRVFECSFPTMQPMHRCWGPSGQKRHNRDSDGMPTLATRRFISIAGHNFHVADAREAMGIDWMNQREIAQAIPPAYSRYLGQAFLAQYAERRCAM